jgi:hypothetical protein
MEFQCYVKLGIWLIFAGFAGIANAGLVSWTDWTIDTAGTSGAAHGSIIQNSSSVGVTYSGDVGWLSPASYWSEAAPAPYTGNSVVDNAPTSGISVSRASSNNTLTFASALIDPVFALYSVGQRNVPVTYSFDQAFTLLSEGYGNWGDGSFSTSGNQLTGNEGHGLIQFSGAVSSISFDILDPENHHGFTVGALTSLEPAQRVTEPATLALMGLGILGITLVRLRSSQAD